MSEEVVVNPEEPVADTFFDPLEYATSPELDDDEFFRRLALVCCPTRSMRTAATCCVRTGSGRAVAEIAACVPCRLSVRGDLERGPR